jgi:hypothetical protein
MNRPALLLSALPLLISIPFVLAALFAALWLVRRRRAARRVGVEGSVADAILGGLRREVQSTLLAREQVYERLRRTGQEARARVLTVMDTSIRIGDQASMLRFNLEVFPAAGRPFRAETQQAISDATRKKFSPGSFVYVRFDPRDASEVALAGPAEEAPRAAGPVDCPSCGAAQRVTGETPACVYCGRPLDRSAH